MLVAEWGGVEVACKCCFFSISLPIAQQSDTSVQDTWCRYEIESQLCGKVLLQHGCHEREINDCGGNRK